MQNKHLPTNVITCDNLTISFGKKKNQTILLDNFNFAFKRNKIYALVGNSGVGKTTLVSHLNGLLKSNQGNIYINDKSILATQKKIRNYKAIRKDVGLVFQFPEYQLFKDTVEKDIAFGPINNYVNKPEIKNLVSKYMYLVGLDKSLSHTSPFDLSNGQKRLCAIAGVLAIESDVIIFDEPTAGLDLTGVNNINKIINNLKKLGKTIIVITHNMDEVLALADEVLVLHNHKLERSGQPYDIYTDARFMQKVGLDQPYVIQTIDQLIRINKKYKYLLDCQPRNIDQLVTFLKKGGK